MVDLFSEVQPSSLVDLLDSIPRDLEKLVRSKGRWLVLISTGSENETGTKEKINVVLCGL
ncbi:hypothetical protein DPMN_083929 [Dreissena polymorpha]|uniref:PLAT domain-containing protein n=1 Tax=Dreissena polymorpha TaxID=45954 RepID=A0A9D3YDF6_DREPO|nr:hypothetical protein DPMN_083929 [Dreissena polymorpha]